VRTLHPDELPNSEPHSERDRWFLDEVRPHEPALRGYLSGSFPTLHDVDDIVQESYLRVWKARASQKITFAKAFLFTVARHVALDFIRRKQKSPVDSGGDLTGLCVLEEGAGGPAGMLDERIEVLAESIARLPDRRREIVILRKLKRLPQKEVAAQLKISERTVENQLFRGMKQCEAYLRSRGINNLFTE
jgi:RNA polymerase sigma factor (sigma-70 family)